MEMELMWPDDRPLTEQRWVNVGGTERWISMAVGSGLILTALAKRDRNSAIAGLVGGALVYRGASGHCPVNAAMGRNSASGENTRVALGGPRGIHVKDSVTIGRPIEELYRFWRNMENLPQFMNHLQSVQRLDDTRSHWVARGPAGMRVEWDAEIINEVPNQVIGWRSLPGADVVSAGSVNFDDAGERGTRVSVHLQYDPPAGRLGALFAKLFGEEPSQQIREDLRRLKRIIETGEVPTTEGQPSGRERERRRKRSA
jgi:uncharacterized membrane protein